MRISDWSSDVCSSDLVHRPEAAAQQAFLPHRVRLQAAQAVQHQADAEHAVDAEQRGMAVGRGEVGALHVEQRQRGVDQEAQQAGADQVPGWKQARSEEHTSELQSLMRISYAVFCLK